MSGSVPGKVTRLPRTKLRRKYTEADLANALSSYQSGAFKSLKAAGQAFGVPSSTLSDKLHGLYIFYDIMYVCINRKYITRHMLCMYVN